MLNGGRQGAAAEVQRRRGCFGGYWAIRRCLRAARGSGGARGRVCVGGGGLEWLVNGEVELVGARVGGGGVLEVWGRELAKE